MHKLNRGATPVGLAAYRHGTHQWNLDSPTFVERQTIWSALDTMQGKRCAYCEARLEPEGRHIEHFRQRGRYPQGTFDWSNLFGSCNRQQSCGKHKDQCGGYNHADLLKPDEDDPDGYLAFISDGTIVPRQNLFAADRRRATETLRVFNLDARHGPLRHMRRSAAVGYLKTAEEFLQFAAEYDESEWRPLLDQELSTIADLPFATVIRHALVGN